MEGNYLFVSDGFDQNSIYTVYIDHNLNVEFELTSVEDKDKEQMAEALISNWPISVNVEWIHESDECKVMMPIAEIIDLDLTKVAEDDLGDFFLSVINYLGNHRSIRIKDEEELAEFIASYCPV